MDEKMLHKRWIELVVCIIALKNEAFPPFPARGGDRPIFGILVDIGTILLDSHV